MNELTQQIERYKRGELTAAERHALERRALDDPFLADALDGIEELTPTQFDEDVKELHKRFDRQKLRRPLLRLAAALFVIASVSGIWLLSQKDNFNEEHLAIEQADNSPQQEDSFTMSQPADSMPASSELASVAQTQPKAADNSSLGDQGTAGDSHLAIDETAVLMGASDEQILPETASSQQQIKTEAQQTLVTQLSEEQFANLPTASDDLERTAGDKSEKVALDSVAPDLRMALQPSASPAISNSPKMDSINRPIGRELRSRFALREKGIIPETPYPTTGLASYFEYLDTHIKYPDAALSAQIEGLVVVGFTVLPDGSVTDFEVLQGVGYGCDEELIRVVKAGPQWVPILINGTPQSSRTSIQYKFSLRDRDR